jgi:hypothetical protein
MASTAAISSGGQANFGRASTAAYSSRISSGPDGCEQDQCFVARGNPILLILDAGHTATGKGGLSTGGGGIGLGGSSIGRGRCGSSRIGGLPIGFGLPGCPAIGELHVESTMT